MQQATESVAWIRRSVAAVRPMMSNAGVAHMERCVEYIDEVARLAPEGGHLAAYRFLPQMLEYVRCMRDPFHMSLQTGELRGLTMVELHAARIIDLHATMMEIIAAEARETRISLHYGRERRQDAAFGTVFQNIEMSEDQGRGEEHLHTLLQ